MRRRALMVFVLCCACSSTPVLPGAATTSSSSSPPSTAPTSESATTSGGSETLSTSSGLGDDSSADGASSGGPTSGEPPCEGVHPGTTVVVDGKIGEDEWNDADGYSVGLEGAGEVVVSIQRDREALHFAFVGLYSPEPSPFLGFPQVILDVGNDKASRLGGDDWLFHVSFRDCAGAGSFEVSDSCFQEPEGWEANNFPNGVRIDVVEISIDFATLGIDPQVEQDLGFMLRTSHTPEFPAQWPGEGRVDDPSTWATLRLCP